MGVRFVSVGRVNPGSDLTYSAVLVTYSRAINPQVRALLSLPEGVELVSVSPPPTSAPAIGSTGEIYWNLGDLAGPANQPLVVVVRVCSDGTLGTHLLAHLAVENAAGERFDLERVSRVGHYDMPNIHKLKTPAFGLSVTALRLIHAGDTFQYRVSAKTSTKAGFSTPTLQMLIPAGIAVGSMSPPPSTLETLPSGATLCVWQLINPGKSIRLKVNAVVAPTLQPGDVMETYVTLDDAQGTQGTVVATQSMP